MNSGQISQTKKMGRPVVHLTPEAKRAARLQNLRRYAARHKERIAERYRQYAASNPDRVAAAKRKYKEKYLATVEGRLHSRISAHVRFALRKGKGGKSIKALLGWTIPQLRRHLEKQFLAGMSWDNMGDWHIDHIIPLASFPEGDALKAWQLPNLRPLWAKDNMAKSDKRTHLL